jgi:hypothetical protein
MYSVQPANHQPGSTEISEPCTYYLTTEVMYVATSGIRSKYNRWVLSKYGEHIRVA